jgi:hypothetical protein
VNTAGWRGLQRFRPTEAHKQGVVSVLKEGSSKSLFVVAKKQRHHPSILLWSRH